MVFLVVAALGLGRLAEAAKVGRDYRVRLRQLRDQWPPHPAGLGKAVQEDDGFALAGGEVMDPHAVDVGEPVLDAGRRRWRRERGGAACDGGQHH
jgi:hypothetical protein